MSRMSSWKQSLKRLVMNLLAYAVERGKRIRELSALLPKRLDQSTVTNVVSYLDNTTTITTLLWNLIRVKLSAGLKMELVQVALLKKDFISSREPRKTCLTIYWKK